MNLSWLVRPSANRHRAGAPSVRCIRPRALTLDLFLPQVPPPSIYPVRFVSSIKCHNSMCFWLSACFSARFVQLSLLRARTLFCVSEAIIARQMHVWTRDHGPNGNFGWIWRLVVIQTEISKFPNMTDRISASTGDRSCAPTILYTSVLIFNTDAGSGPPPLD